MTGTFCGHSEIYQPETVRKWLYKITEEMIDQGADMFLLGGYGTFDHMAASVVWDLKKKHPDIQSVLVLPYLDAKMDESKCDWTVYPNLEEVPRHFAIPHRNRWMVEQADFVIAYVTHSWGGSARTMEYALQKKKPVILYHEEVTSAGSWNTFE